MSAFDQDAVTDQHREEGKHLAALVTAKDTPNYRRVLRDNEAFLARWICDQEKKPGPERSASTGATTGSHHNTSTSVRELEWEEVGGRHFARTPFGTYETQDDEGGEWWTGFDGKSICFDDGLPPIFQTLEGAKAACQSDFQKRITECLEPTNCEPKASDATGWKHEDFESWWLDYEMPSGGHRPYEKLGSVTTGTLCEWAFNAGRATLPPPPGTDAIYQDAHRASVRSTIATSMKREEALNLMKLGFDEVVRHKDDQLEALRAENTELKSRYDKLEAAARAIPTGGYCEDCRSVGMRHCGNPELCDGVVWTVSDEAILALRSALSPKEGE